MVLLIPAQRALAIRLAPRTFHIATRLGSSSWLSRVESTSSRQNDHQAQSLRACDRQTALGGLRRYATATSTRAAGRPKAHTGRTPAKRTRTTAKKPGPKTAAGKAKVGRKPKKATTAKAKPKPKPKPKVKKAPSKNALQIEARKKRAELKAAALLEEPKKLPQTPWGLIFAEAHAKGSSLAETQASTKAAAEKLKNLTPEDKERYNHEAHANKSKNETAYKRWLSQHTPDQIRQANNARRQLAKIDQEKTKKKHRSGKFATIKDDRLVKRPRSSYNIFHSERYRSGDFEKMAVSEAAKLIGREWKALSATAKKNYEDEASADRNRYIAEHKTVFGTEPRVAA